MVMNRVRGGRIRAALTGCERGLRGIWFADRMGSSLGWEEGEADERNQKMSSRLESRAWNCHQLEIQAANCKPRKRSRSCLGSGCATLYSAQRPLRPLPGEGQPPNSKNRGCLSEFAPSTSTLYR